MITIIDIIHIFYPAIIGWPILLLAKLCSVPVYCSHHVDMCFYMSLYCAWGGRSCQLFATSVYSFVARRASLQTGIIPLPGHVMLRLYGRHQNLIVDPFHGGEARNQDDLVEYLREHGLRFNPVWMHDASPKLLLARQVANLRNSLRSIGLVQRSQELQPLLDGLGS